MRGIHKGLLGLMTVLTLAGCGGAPEATEDASLGQTEQGIACRSPDNSCPGTTVCVDGLCRDCVRQPQFCQ
ncbi:hypothetical protein LZ198_09920 [Myxococcus sp. K15C18031901]|uniref:hypothetical protein n=1 Tax=Myxococcus dinghuensis TaxID=2906761 RepID=UPI0020A72D4E|nr:hypothetical protein [Myxococcus dinghuensis]MCP3099185.1 hypothetical protein [Myxococcus dinghuensis]